MGRSFFLLAGLPACLLAGFKNLVSLKHFLIFNAFSIIRGVLPLFFQKYDIIVTRQQKDVSTGL